MTDACEGLEQRGETKRNANCLRDFQFSKFFRVYVFVIASEVKLLKQMEQQCRMACRQKA